MSSPWHLDQRSGELDLDQNQGTADDAMDPSVVALQFSDNFTQALVDDQDQAQDQDQDLEKELERMPSPSMDFEPTPASLAIPKEDSPAKSPPVGETQYVQPEAVLKDATARSPGANPVQLRQCRVDTEESTQDAVHQEAATVTVYALARSLAAGLEDDDKEERPDVQKSGDDDGPCESPNTNLDSPPSSGLTSNEKDEDEIYEKLDRSESTPPSSPAASLDLEDEEKAIKFLKKLKSEGKLEKLVKKLNTTQAKKPSPGPASGSENQHPCPHPTCDKSFPRKCELKYVGSSPTPQSTWPNVL